MRPFIDIMTHASEDWIEGVSNEVISMCVMFIIFAVAMYFYKRQSNLMGSRIHPDSNVDISATRVALQNRTATRRFGNAESACPVCLGALSFGIETNCAHVFCGSCIVSYWRTGRWLGPVACPICRQTVTVLLTLFNEVEQQPEHAQDRNAVLQEINEYNRRFSGEPRSIAEYIADLPTILRHALSDLFSVDGMILVFRARILVCLILAVLYVLSPLDLIPELAVGVLGFLDDFFIIFLVAIYITMIYRSVLASRSQNTAEHHVE